MGIYGISDIKWPGIWPQSVKRIVVLRSVHISRLFRRDMRGRTTAKKNSAKRPFQNKNKRTSRLGPSKTATADQWPPTGNGKDVKGSNEELRSWLTTTEAVPKTCVPGQMKLIQEPTLAKKSFNANHYSPVFLRRRTKFTRDKSLRRPTDWRQETTHGIFVNILEADC